MKRSFNKGLKVLFFSFLAFFSFSQSGFAASKKNSQKQKTEDLTEAVKLPSAKRTFFAKIDPEILSNVENGSPESLKNAMSLIRKVNGDYDETEKILIKISTELMKSLWPSEKLSWDDIDCDSENPYIGAIESFHNGVFDSSTGNQDFLSTFLPCLTLLSPVCNSSMYPQIQKALEDSLAKNPASVMANYLMGILKEKTEDYEKSEEYLKLAFDKASKNKELSLEYINVLKKNQHLELANQIISSFSDETSDLEILKQKAYIAFDAKDYVTAEQYVARVLQQTPNNLEFVLFRAKILVEKGDYIHAVSLLDLYERQDEDSIDYLILRARTQLDWSKNTQAATQTIEKAIQLYPDNIEALMIGAQISSSTDSPVAGKYADELVAKILEKDPSNVEAQIYAINGLIQRENWEEAYTICKKLISGNERDITPDFVEKYVTVCIKLEKYNEAFEYAKRAYNAKPEDETLAQAYIYAYSQIGNRDVVIKYIDSLMPDASSKMKSYLYYRRSFLQLTQDNQLSDLRSSLISNPRNTDALFRLYEIYYSKDDYRKAQYYLRQVVAINPNDTTVKKLNEALTQLIK